MIFFLLYVDLLDIARSVWIVRTRWPLAALPYTQFHSRSVSLITYPWKDGQAQRIAEAQGFDFRG